MTSGNVAQYSCRLGKPMDSTSQSALTHAPLNGRKQSGLSSGSIPKVQSYFQSYNGYMQCPTAAFVTKR